ncbi:MAG TPA: OsmC family protein [Candidatus Eisenbacteria bacterium]|nr:OsmC family protein [Candidatus Eisenbacteria bacterium]
MRALASGDGHVRLVTRNLTFDAERQLGLDPGAAHPAALDLLVGALATDLLAGLGREAARAGTPLYDVELRLEARLGNPLVALGVVGEVGSPALASVQGTLYVGGDADEAQIHALWETACARAPVFATLRNTASINITIRLVP